MKYTYIHTYLHSILDWADAWQSHFFHRWGLLIDSSVIIAPRTSITRMTSESMWGFTLVRNPMRVHTAHIGQQWKPDSGAMPEPDTTLTCREEYQSTNCLRAFFHLLLPDGIIFITLSFPDFQGRVQSYYQVLLTSVSLFHHKAKKWMDFSKLGSRGFVMYCILMSFMKCLWSKWTVL